MSGTPESLASHAASFVDDSLSNVVHDAVLHILFYQGSGMGFFFSGVTVLSLNAMLEGLPWCEQCMDLVLLLTLVQASRKMYAQSNSSPEDINKKLKRK